MTSTITLVSPHNHSNNILEMSLTSPTAVISPTNTLSPPNTLLQFNNNRNESISLPQFNDRMNSYGDLQFDYKTDLYTIHSPNNTFDTYNKNSTSIFDEKTNIHDILPSGINMPNSPNNIDKHINITYNDNPKDLLYSQEEKQPEYPVHNTHIQQPQQQPTVPPLQPYIQPVAVSQRIHSSVDDVTSSGTRSELSYDSEIDQRQRHNLEEELDIDFDLDLDHNKIYNAQRHTQHYNNVPHNTYPHTSKTVPSSPRRHNMQQSNDWHPSQQQVPVQQQQYSRTPTQQHTRTSTQYVNNSMSMPTQHTPARMHSTNNNTRANLFSPTIEQAYLPPHNTHMPNMHPNGMFSAPVSPRSQYSNPAYNYADIKNSSSIPLTHITDENDDSVVVGRYTKAERRRKIIRFQEKKQRRTWHKKILYACRKTFADKRPRVGGRFVKMVTLQNGERVPFDSPEAIAYTAAQQQNKTVNVVNTNNSKPESK